MSIDFISHLCMAKYSPLSMTDREITDGKLTGEKLLMRDGERGGAYNVYTGKYDDCLNDGDEKTNRVLTAYPDVQYSSCTTKN